MLPVDSSVRVFVCHSARPINASFTLSVTPSLMTVMASQTEIKGHVRAAAVNAITHLLSERTLYKYQSTKVLKYRLSRQLHFGTRRHCGHKH